MGANRLENPTENGEKMIKETINYVDSIMNSMAFRVIILLLGLILFSCYGILVIAAIFNWPGSWLFFSYCLAGVIAGILCFIYFFKKNKFYFIIILPFIIDIILLYLFGKSLLHG